MRGYRAFLMGTATDLPTRGFTVQRRDDVEAAAGLSGVVTAAGSKTGVRAIQWNTKVNR